MSRDKPARPGLCSDPACGYAFVVRDPSQVDLGRIAREVTAPVAVVEVGAFAIAVVTQIGMMRTLAVGGRPHPDASFVTIWTDDGVVPVVNRVAPDEARGAWTLRNGWAWDDPHRVHRAAERFVAVLRERERAAKAKRKTEQASLVRVTVKPVRGGR